MRIKIIGPKHLGQIWGRIAMRLASNKTATDDMMLTSAQAGALQNSQSPMVPCWDGDGATMGLSLSRRCPILLTLEKLTNDDAATVQRDQAQ